MPRGIATYTGQDWLRLRPFVQAYKSSRLNRLDRRYSDRPPDDMEAFESITARLAGRNLIATIAFNAPWAIDWQLKFVGRHLQNAAFLVADNSTSSQARRHIAALCAAHDLPYLALPSNPYFENRHASRSHGLALNWVYRNVMRRLRPAAWGFFDHDLFPTRAFDPRQRLRGQPFYGHLEQRPGGAYLWPGYCLFSAEADQKTKLDFRQDWFIGLDTGGMNAGFLARWPGFPEMSFARSRSIGPGRNLAVTADEIDWMDDCVHLANASGWYAENAGRESALDSLLERILSGELRSPLVD